MTKTRIAVVSSDGRTVDEHFGRAGCFWIYDLGDSMRLVEKRKTETLSVGNPDHPFDPDRFQRIAAALHDCGKVYVTRIGDQPAAALRRLGIEPVVYAGAIGDIRS
jgi:nitrogen fixation protein NifX